MTETHEPIQQGAPPEPPASTGAGHRLVRLTDQKKVGGVAAGLGYSFGLDPTLVRVGFAVAGLLSFGVAIAVYGLLWWLLPASTVAASGLSTPPPGAGRAHGFQVAAVVVGVVLLSQVQWLSGQVVLAVVLIGIGLVLFNDGSGPSAVDGATRWLRTTFSSATRTGHVTPPPSSPAPPAPAAPPPPAAPPWSAYTDPYLAGQRHARPLPPAPRPRRERSALGPLTLAVWLVAMGAASVLDGLGLLSLTTARAASLTVLIAGIGLLVGTFVGRARGLIVLGLLAGVLWVGATVSRVDFGVPLSGGVGERSYMPVTVEELTDYRLGAGQLVLDLSDLDLDGVVTVPVTASVGLGELRVIVPDDVTVRATGGLQLGDYDILGTASDGTRLSFDVQDAGDERNGALHLDLSAGVGEITVSREASQ